jgi:DNA-binding winged helix-turn-helix (wHTH) protein
MQVETSTVFAKGTRPKRTGVLQIDDQVLEASARQLAILECLHENLGTVVSYARLCSILGLTSDERKHLHLLRQYVKFNSDMLEANRLPYVITVAREAGYALCRILPRPASTVDPYQNAAIDDALGPPRPNPSPSLRAMMEAS